MKKSRIFFILLLIPVLLTCDKDILNPKSISLATLKGSVVESVHQTPLSGVRVRASNHPESVQTDSLGQYTLEVELETSTSSEIVTVTAQKEGYDPFELKDVTIEANKTVEIPTISLEPAAYIAYIEGMVIDISGNPLEGVLITISNHAESGVTDNSGEFSFSVGIDNPTEDVTLTAQKVGYRSFQLASLTIAANETVTVPTISLEPETYIAYIEGMVIDTSGAPLEDVLITISDNAETGVTDSTGEFSFPVGIDSPSETVLVSATKPFYDYADPDVEENGGIQVTLESKQTTIVPTFVLISTSRRK